MLPNATIPRGGYIEGGCVAAAADRRGSLGSLSSCSNGCEVQGNGAWDCMLCVTQYLVKSLVKTNSFLHKCIQQRWANTAGMSMDGNYC